ncbi:PhzF family phenazine biosynthesis isomerase [candidate division CSSED10-310 bacterium]|uniref:PhzF family phenazine biosynthesis isomerase n=1 Tax=candidate division CSSED10-310 bacterium TaxID=2855610 RepID=A0ABV6Z186_UNCC1
MREFSYLQVNTFTSKPFAGNPVGVITQGMGLTDDEMQNIAYELNLSHTVFILPATEPARANSRLRHFSRNYETSSNQNATLASVWVMIMEHWLPLPENGSYYYHIEQSLTDTMTIEIRCQLGDNYLVFLPSTVPQLDQPPEELVQSYLSRSGCPQNSLDQDLNILLEPEQGYLLLPLKSNKSLMDLQLKPQVLSDLYQEFNITCLPLVIDCANDNLNIQQRHFPSLKTENGDVMNCSAAATAAAYMMHHTGRELADGITHVTVEQSGYGQRTGHFQCEFLIQHGKVTNLKIGGIAAIVMTGKVILPE